MYPDDRSPRIQQQRPPGMAAQRWNQDKVQIAGASRADLVALSKPRDRVINFRISDAEYVRLKSAARISGARTVSEFSRVSILKATAEIESPSSPAQSDDLRVELLEQRLSFVEASVGRLENLLTGIEAHMEGLHAGGARR
jgi:hypothetical protein